MDLYETAFLLFTSNGISMLPTPFLGKIETILASMRYLSHSFAKAQQSSDWNDLVSSRDKTFRYSLTVDTEAFVNPSTYNVKFKVLKAEAMKITVFWDLM